MFIEELETLAKECHEYALAKGWHQDKWEHSAYLFLECAELVEATRGKGKSLPIEELADVLFVLLSLCHEHSLSMSQALTILYYRLEGKDICPKKTQDQKTT